MKTTRLPLFPAVALFLAATILSSLAETRMQVAASTPIRARAEDSAPILDTANPGEIFFVTSTSGAFSAIDPPTRIGLWLNRDFVEGNRVVAKSVQLRTGPGLEFDVAGSLSRGAAILKLSEKGEWLQIAPPSSASVYVLSSALQPVPVATEPIGEVETVPEPAPTDLASAEPPPEFAPPTGADPKATPLTELATLPASPAPASVYASHEATPKISPSIPDSQKSVLVASTPAPAKPAPAPAAKPAPVAKPTRPTAPRQPGPIAPSQPGQPSPATLRTNPRPSSPAPAATPAHGARPLRPALATLPPANQPGMDIPPTQANAHPAYAPAAATARHGAPASAPAVVRNFPTVPEDLIDDLDLDPDVSSQGKHVRVTGQLRVAPIHSASPSRYRLLSLESGLPETLCDVHGRSDELRPYIGKTITIRGQAYRVVSSQTPVVVVGEILP